MLILRSTHLVGVFLLISLTISAIQSGALGARYLEDYTLEDGEISESWRKSSTKTPGDEGFVATINREVPSSPDPLHNRCPNIEK
ncbi:hypothetical protein RJ640_017659 [Escallonia rubra]|uniref:Uncharacterized protein n=1 Tax=Escallonia rubra TaxID=112253 RepID=A0AA88QMM0_9ASTE|nr:hypothetical protein RJ640_017659 [Escallonia rubra]